MKRMVCRVEDEFTFGVYIPTCGRYGRGMITGKLFESPKHVVRKSEEQAYADAGFVNIVAVEDKEIAGYAPVYNWIVDNAEEDVIVICDDDVKNFIYRTDTNVPITDVETCQAEFERLGQLIWDLDLGIAFGSATPTPYVYTSEFGWYGIPGAFKVVNRRCVKARMDTLLQRNTDIDYVLQELLKNRVCLNAKYLCDNPFEDDTTNTSGSKYNPTAIAASVEMMESRWGRHFSYNSKKNVPMIHVER